jgi:hypothetical protein
MIVENLRLYGEARCLSEASMRMITSSEADPFRVHSDFDGVETVVRCVRVRIKGWSSVYLADKVTGTLYREDTGRCLTSAYRRIVGPADDAPAGKQNKARFCYGTQPISTASTLDVEKREKRINTKKAPAQVTEDIVRQIRATQDGDYLLAPKLCQQMFGIGEGTVYDIRHRRTWRHVE